MSLDNWQVRFERLRCIGHLDYRQRGLLRGWESSVAFINVLRISTKYFLPFKKRAHEGCPHSKGIHLGSHLVLMNDRSRTVERRFLLGAFVCAVPADRWLFCSCEHTVGTSIRRRRILWPQGVQSENHQIGLRH